MRSLLFTPGNHARRVEKALNESGADAAILDLEDAVAVSEKEGARGLVAGALKGARQTRAYVRVNGIETPWFFGDLAGVICPELDGVMLPKTAGEKELYLADRYLSYLERERGLSSGSIEVLPLIETAAGVAALREICGCRLQRVRRIAFGAADFTIDVGCTWTPAEDELLFARTQMVLFSRVGGLEPPIDTVYLNVQDQEGLKSSTRRARELGFQGRLCIHPNQVAIANGIFTPTDEEVGWAEEVVGAFAEAEARGIAAIQVRGALVDYPVVRKAEQILAHHRRSAHRC